MELIKRGIKVKEVSHITDIPVSSIYYKPSNKDIEDEKLLSCIQEIAFKHTFYGYRRIHLALKQQGLTVNHKKVYRLYRALNLQRCRAKKNRKTIIPSSTLTEPQYRNHVWAIDFLFDTLIDGRLIKLMPVEDLFSRFSLGIDVHFSISSRRTIEFLEECFRKYGKPDIIRTDQGSEFRSNVFRRFLESNRIRHEFIEKASPWQNGNLESLIGKLRDECLNRRVFDSLQTAQEVVERYRMFYNNERPHSGLNNKTPYEEYWDA